VATSASSLSSRDMPVALPAPTLGLISVIIVTADSGFGIGDCIQRVLASSCTVEVVVVDNASRDGSVEQLAVRFAKNPQVRILHNDKNTGFGAACNRGAVVARGDVLVLLNPDCLVEVSTLARLRSVIDGDAHIGAVGALQVDGTGHVDPASRRRDPLLRRALMRISGLSRYAANAATLEGFEWSSSGPALELVDAISGALMMLPRSVFERLQGFDEAYFLHCEDLDLCHRVRDAGLAVVCANEVRVLHGKGGSSRHRPVFVAWHKHRGMWRWFNKFDPAAHNPLIRFVVYCGIWAHFACQLPLLISRRIFRARAS
jgi:N-acetylglucosaminyl-diphospho-decaprenol L-rhamnosyltransferase